jgi:hypothetical protein
MDDFWQGKNGREKESTLTNFVTQYHILKDQQMHLFLWM